MRVWATGAAIAGAGVGAEEGGSEASGALGADALDLRVPVIPSKLEQLVFKTYYRYPAVGCLTCSACVFRKCMVFHHLSAPLQDMTCN